MAGPCTKEDKIKFMCQDIEKHDDTIYGKDGLVVQATRNRDDINSFKVIVKVCMVLIVLLISLESWVQWAIYQEIKEHVRISSGINVTPTVPLPHKAVVIVKEDIWKHSYLGL
jgi:hypothetical protein